MVNPYLELGASREASSNTEGSASARNQVHHPLASFRYNHLGDQPPVALRRIVLETQQAGRAIARQRRRPPQAGRPGGAETSLTGSSCGSIICVQMIRE